MERNCSWGGAARSGSGWSAVVLTLRRNGGAPYAQSVSYGDRMSRAACGDFAPTGGFNTKPRPAENSEAMA